MLLLSTGRVALPWTRTAPTLSVARRTAARIPSLPFPQRRLKKWLTRSPSGKRRILTLPHGLVFLLLRHGAGRLADVHLPDSGRGCLRTCSFPASLFTSCASPPPLLAPLLLAFPPGPRLPGGGSSSVGGDLQQYGCPQAHLRTGPLRPTSGLGHSGQIQTVTRFPVGLLGSQLPSPECKGTRLTPLEALLTPYRSLLCKGHNKPLLTAFGHASLRPCSAPAPQRLLISSYPAPNSARQLHEGSC